MPRWASRIDCLIKAVRVEKLQDINEDDAIKEGLTAITENRAVFKYGVSDRNGWASDMDGGLPWTEWDTDPRIAFMKLWQKVNGAGTWEENPWVWVVEFERVKP